jgi:acyl-CoA thioester hydrolase
MNVLLTRSVDVRWGDMDAFGHVNNTAYFVYCESARIAFFEHVDLESYAEEGKQLGPALATASCAFRQQVHYPAKLEVDVGCSRVGGSSFTLTYRLRRAGQEDVVAEGESVVVWTDYAIGRSTPLPADLRSLLDPDPEVA